MFRNECGGRDWSRMVLCALFWICMAVVVFWASDRDPPFELTAYNVPIVKRGTMALVTATVRRDTKRDCSLTYSRYIFDSQGYRYDVGQEQVMTAAGVKEVENRTHGVLRVAVPISSSASPGRAKLVTALEYACNPVQAIWPIHVTTTMEMEITP